MALVNYSGGGPVSGSKFYYGRGERQPTAAEQFEQSLAGFDPTGGVPIDYSGMTQAEQAAADAVALLNPLPTSLNLGDPP